jgi:hypothetical protein
VRRRAPAAAGLAGAPGVRGRFTSIEAAAIAGILCAAGWSAALFGFRSVPSITAGDAEIASYYNDPDVGRKELLLLNVAVIATIAFVWFVGVIRGRLGEAEPRLLGTVFLGGALITAALVLVGFAALTAPAVLADARGRAPDPGSIATMRALATTTLAVCAPRFAALVMISTATLARATGALPRWLVLTTYAAGLVTLVVVTVSEPAPYVFPTWIALVSVVLLVRRPDGKLARASENAPEG